MKQIKLAKSTQPTPRYQYKNFALGEQQVYRIKDYPYSWNKKVRRYEFTDQSKQPIPYVGNQAGRGTELWPLYRINDAIANGQGAWITFPEGEKCTDAVADIGISAISAQSFYKKEEIINGLTQLKAAEIKGILMIPDNDQSGIVRRNIVGKICLELNIPFLSLPPKELGLTELGADIADWVEFQRSKGLSNQEIGQQFRDIAQSAVDVDIQGIVEAEEQAIRDKKEAEAQRKAEKEQFLAENPSLADEQRKIEDALEEALQRLGEDAYDVVAKYKDPKYLYCDCPRHKSSSKKSLIIDRKKLLWFCFGCQIGGGVPDFYYFKKYGQNKPRGKDFIEVAEKICNDAHVEFPRIEKTYKQQIESTIAILKNEIAKQETEEALAREAEEAAIFKAQEAEEREIKETKERSKFETFFKGKIINLFQDKTKTKFASPQPKKNDNEALYFEPGQRLEAVKMGIQSGSKYILDISSTGTGKSHLKKQMVNAEIDKFEVDRIMFVDDDHRNQTIPEMMNIIDVDSRHEGLILRDGQIRRANSGDKDLTTFATCKALDMFTAMRDAGIEGADAASTGCCTCPYLPQCASNSKNRDPKWPNFIHQRSQALKHPYLRIHPQSLPNPKTKIEDDSAFDYSKTLLHFEEADKSLKYDSIITINLSDVKETLTDYITVYLDWTSKSVTSDEIVKILGKIAKILKDPNKPYYGYSHNEILQLIGEINLSKDEQKEIYEALKPDLSFLAEKMDRVGNVRESISDALAEDEIKRRIEKTKKLPKQWLHHFFGIIFKQVLGDLRISGDHLIIKIFNPRIANIVREAKVSVFASATLNRETLSKILRCEPDEIFVICQEEDFPQNLIIKQVPIGYLGVNRGNDQSKRSEAAINAIYRQNPNAKIDVIGFKKHGANKYWWNHSRGSNEFYNQGVTHLILDGTPCENLGSLAADYHLLYGHVPTETQLKAYSHQKTLIELTQAIGRPRANLREEKITIWLLSDIDISLMGFPYEVVDLGELDPKCLDREGRIKRLIGEAIAYGKKTITDVADHAGKSISRISQIAKKFGGFKQLKKILLSLLKAFNSETEKISEVPKDLSDMACEFFGLAIETDSVVDGIVNYLKIHGSEKYERAIGELEQAEPSLLDSLLGLFIGEIAYSFGIET